LSQEKTKSCISRGVAAEAAIEVGGRIGRLVGAEQPIFPFADALALRVIARPRWRFSVTR
jgi:hypothetical protein